jgi:multiple sugar transport system ATP-binding protein
VREPAVFLLDEPLSNLDAQVRDSMRTELKKLFRGINATVLYVTHDQTEAMMMSDFLVVMDGGAIRQTGEPTHVYQNPTHRFVAEFIGTHRINTLTGRLENGRFQSADGRIAFDTTIRKQGEVLLEIRPERLSFGTQEDVKLNGETVLVEPMGSSNLISVKVGKNELKMFLTRRPSEGEHLSLSFSSRNALFFDPHSGLRLQPGP